MLASRVTDEVAWELESPECSSCLPVYAVGGGGGRSGGLGEAGPVRRGSVERPLA